ncbi:MAG: aspartate 1-decarboxylase [Phycisphaerae bacterium]|nr:aspartate 1-decarboxylase [Phycisphaerae bacterium]MDD5381730.1 aspartate 1-decarboxylase [Phycisphaerae bacterium]
MFVKLLKSKLHCATVTETKLRYQGSIAIDAALMKAANILPYEVVQIADLNNGNRLQTYAIPADANSGKVVVLGPAAKLVRAKDTIIVFSFGYYNPAQARKVKPKVVILGKNNKIKNKG